MIAFEIYLNSQKLCTAGVEGDVLSTFITWARGHHELLSLSVEGLLPSEQSAYWVVDKQLQIGDEIEVQIIETETVDTPTIPEPGIKIKKPGRTLASP